MYSKGVTYKYVKQVSLQLKYQCIICTHVCPEIRKNYNNFQKQCNKIIVTHENYGIQVLSPGPILKVAWTQR